MIAFLVRATVKTLLLAGVLYVVFFVKIEQSTTYEHVRRIAGTNEAQQFGSEVAGVVGRAKATALQTVGGNRAGNGASTPSQP